MGAQNSFALKLLGKGVFHLMSLSGCCAYRGGSRVRQTSWAYRIQLCAGVHRGNAPMPLMPKFLGLHAALLGEQVDPSALESVAINLQFAAAVQALVHKLA
jgi:hypothetical protein